ncbi:hypothetical protein TSUD_83450 [Trifolium subterraneum]|uniref:Reverse transcriptase domain-containing protein n=1 Tax=Trifolium subterraneum TaxID=3900 RepID=A0A2Z6NA93_TRISU|nr:hypothetical protein TSUD_83450 [Trifolium subterraneum]
MKREFFIFEVDLVSHLQYIDDTIFYGEAKVENLWMLKAILRDFELASSIKVNFFESSVMSVNCQR